MDEYIIDEYVPRKFFQKWKKEKGMYVNVIPLEFISYVKNSNGNIIRFREGDKTYEGQKWRCKFLDGKRKICTFRVAVHPIDLEEDNYDSEFIQDPTDLISGNEKLLKLQIKKEIELIKHLKTKKDPLSKARVRFLECPCEKTLNDFLYWREQARCQQ